MPKNRGFVDETLAVEANLPSPRLNSTNLPSPRFRELTSYFD